MSGHKPWPPPSKAESWNYSPYVGWGMDEADVCDCDSRYCTDCSPVKPPSSKFAWYFYQPGSPEYVTGRADWELSGKKGRKKPHLDAWWAAEMNAKRPDWVFRAWLTFYKIKRWFEVRLPSNG